ncbi:MAG: purine-binding chemotaxis protein CheW [Chthoniobacter sp.]|nr:purine-binding chemotaxis protein CheW [Chthoniobacter sp.]
MTSSLVLFDLDGFRFALDASRVQRVVPAVEIAPVPDLPPGVRGVISVRGDVVPVFDLRLRLGLPSRAVRLNDHFLIAKTSRRLVALIVDVVSGVVPRHEAQVASPSQILPGLSSIEGWIKLDGELVLIQDLEKFLTPEQDAALEAALAR